MVLNTGLIHSGSEASIWQSCIHIKLLYSFFKFRSLDEQTSVLLFTSLQEKDAGNYSCTASNSVDSDVKTANLIVKGNFRYKNNS